MGSSGGRGGDQGDKLVWRFYTEHVLIRFQVSFREAFILTHYGTKASFTLFRHESSADGLRVDNDNVVISLNVSRQRGKARIHRTEPASCRRLQRCNSRRMKKASCEAMGCLTMYL